MKPDLHVKLVNDFNLPPEYQKEIWNYYLLHWSTLYTFRKLAERPDGLIEHSHRLFIPVFKSESFPLDSTSQLMLSFRVPHDTENGEIHKSGIPNYVLIKAMS